MLQNKRLFDSVLVIGALGKTGSLVSNKLASMGIPHKTAETETTVYLGL